MFNRILKSSVFLLLVFTSAITAQDQKIGFFDSGYILNRIPEYTGLEQQLALTANQWRSEIQELEDEIIELEKDYEAKEILYTEEIRDQKLLEIEQKKDEKDALLDRRFGPNGDYFKQQELLLEPIQRQVIQAVQTVAQRNGYDFVFDTANDFKLVYARNEWNLNNEILIELGIEVDDESN